MASRRRAIAAGCVAVALSGLLSGCSNDLIAGDPVGMWVSDKGTAAFQLNEDGSGEYTQCEADHDYYSYKADSWPSTIPITWDTHSNPFRAPDLNLYQDWEAKESTGTGFDTVNMIFRWGGGKLVQADESSFLEFAKSPNEKFTCPQPQ